MDKWKLLLCFIWLLRDKHSKVKISFYAPVLFINCLNYEKRSKHRGPSNLFTNYYVCMSVCISVCVYIYNVSEGKGGKSNIQWNLKIRNVKKETWYFDSQNNIGCGHVGESLSVWRGKIQNPWNYFVHSLNKPEM